MNEIYMELVEAEGNISNRIEVFFSCFTFMSQTQNDLDRKDVVKVDLLLYINKYIILNI